MTEGSAEQDVRGGLGKGRRKREGGGGRKGTYFEEVGVMG